MFHFGIATYQQSGLCRLAKWLKLVIDGGNGLISSHKHNAFQRSLVSVLMCIVLAKLMTLGLLDVTAHGDAPSLGRLKSCTP
jgi:hypothetical protein